MTNITVNNTTNLHWIGNDQLCDHLWIFRFFVCFKPESHLAVLRSSAAAVDAAAAAAADADVA